MALSRRTGQRFQGSIWPGFVDAMTGLLLVLMFVLTIFMVVQAVLRDTITGQETQLDSLTARLAGLAEALGLEQTRNAALETQLGELNATLDTNSALLDEQQAIITALTATRDRQAQQIAGFEDQVAALLADKEAANLRISELTASEADLEAARAALLDERDALNLALATARSEIDSQVEEARLAAARREAMEALIADLRAQNADAEALGAGLSAQVDALEQALSEEEAQRLAEAEAAAALRKRLEDADTELTAMTMALEAERQRAEDTLTLLAAAREVGDDLNAKLAAALLEGETAAQALKAEQDQRAAVEEALAEATEAGDRQLTKLSNLEAQLAAALLQAQRADQLLLDLEAAEAVNRDLTLRAETAETRVARQDADLTDLHEELVALRSLLETERNAAADAASTAADQQADLALQLQEVRRVLELTRSEALDRAANDDALLEDLRSQLAALDAARRDGAERAEALSSELSQRSAQLAAAQSSLKDSDARGAALQAELDALRAQLDLARAEAVALRAQTENDQRSLEEQLASALAAQMQANLTADETRDQLAAALAAKRAAEAKLSETMTEAETRAALLSTARDQLADQQAQTTKAEKQTELLNQQVAALRRQLSSLQALLDESQAKDAAAQVQLQSLGSELNTALARVASEERKRRELEEAERKRLEAEAARLAAEAQDLEKYRSEFFGRLRDLLGNQEGIRIEGDRFVFSSEVLFAPGRAELSDAGQAEIAKVARILRGIAADIPSEIDWVIRVDGHTDNVPLSGLGEFADNWELSQARALSVVRFMINFLGIPPERLAANGFGQYQPVNTADTNEARAQNRRIELKLTEK